MQILFVINILLNQVLLLQVVVATSLVQDQLLDREADCLQRPTHSQLLGAIFLEQVKIHLLRLDGIHAELKTKSVLRFLKVSFYFQKILMELKISM